MIDMVMFGKIRRMYFRDKLSINEISRRTSLSRNTVKKWLRQPEGTEPIYQRGPVAGKLTAYETWLEQALTNDAHRAKRDRRSARALYQQLCTQGYEGGYSRVTDFIRHWRTRAGKNPVHAFIPLSFEWGEAFQFDWSEERLVIGGVWRKLQVAHTKLCASRAFWLSAYFSQGHEMLFDAHTRAFSAFGGVPRRGIYDNMKTAVDRVPRGKNPPRQINARFSVMCSHYLFDADFCNVAAGWEKGIVEKNVQDARRRIWQEAAQERFGHLNELNAWLWQRCQALWSALPHPEHKPLSIADMLEQERGHLMSMPSAFDGYVEILARVSSTCLIHVLRNHYSVPCEWVGQMVSVRLYPTHLIIIGSDERIAHHERLLDRGQTRYDWQHYIPIVQRKPGALRNGAPFTDMPEPLCRLRQILLAREGGSRVMAQVLAAVPGAGLEAVWVAVELVLESGVASLEHVLNMLNRLKPGPQTETVPTLLQVKQPPLANTQRYDQLYDSSMIHEVHHA